MIDKIDSVVNVIGGFLYQPYIVPLFLIVAGLYFTIRTGLIQFRLFGESIHVVAEKPKEKGSISSFFSLIFFIFLSRFSLFSISCFLHSLFLSFIRLPLDSPNPSDYNIT